MQSNVHALFIISTLYTSLTIEQFLMHPYPGCTMFSISMHPLLLPNPEGVQFMMPPNPEGVQFLMQTLWIFCFKNTEIDIKDYLVQQIYHVHISIK